MIADRQEEDNSWLLFPQIVIIEGNRVVISCMVLTDAEVRKRGEQTGLDTLVVHAVNDEY